jgi:hypothetical protein
MKLRMLKRIACWWFGCYPDYEAMQHDFECVPCERCGAPDTTYGDRIGDTLHNRTMDWVRYWLWRRWFPEKCYVCGSRFGHNEGCDGIPF